MSARRRPEAKPVWPSRILDVRLMPGMDNRMAAIRAVASGALPVEAVSINLWKIKEWAHDVHQPEGEIYGFRIQNRASKI
jgi:hypothetical protein